MSSSVCVVSSNDISREGLAHFLRIEGFDVFKSINSVEEMAETSDRFLAVVDEPDSAFQFEAVEELKSRAENAMPVILAERFDMAAMLACFQAGAQGYIVKTIRSQPLMTSLRLAALGEKVIPSDLLDALDSSAVSTPMHPAPVSSMASTNLSPRECDVLCCLMAGYPNKTIARQLDVCEATVKVHVKAILRKLKVRNRTQAAIWASSNGVGEGSLM
ncbi:MAG: response regulator transcription factor [Sphingomonadales bacterium]|nr:response regulator transcription factor [Sphingomonadales bacterium]